MSRRAAINPPVSAAVRRASWFKTLIQWHWISAALALVGLLMFAITGITLNHASQIEAKPAVRSKQAQLPAALKAALATPTSPAPPTLPADVVAWLAAELQVDVAQRAVEWSATEAYVPLPRPGGDAWLRIDRKTGAVEHELTDRGWVSYLNDLHKGRHTGAAWSWFIDLFALACGVFAVTGLLILQWHAARRPSTWPMVGLGLLVPLLLAIVFVH